LTNTTARPLAPQPRHRTRGFEVEHLPAGAEADAIAIVDPGGYLVYFERMQDAHLGSVQFAVDKARSAVLFRRPTKVCEDALLRLIGTSILGPQGAEAGDEPSAVNTVREWSDAELNELGNMLVRGLSIEQIAQLLRRDHGDVRDKVVEVGRACR